MKVKQRTSALLLLREAVSRQWKTADELARSLRPYNTSRRKARICPGLLGECEPYCHYRGSRVSEPLLSSGHALDCRRERPLWQDLVKLVARLRTRSPGFILPARQLSSR
jgi:hypothetical protein